MLVEFVFVIGTVCADASTLAELGYEHATSYHREAGFFNILNIL